MKRGRKPALADVLADALTLDRDDALALVRAVLLAGKPRRGRRPNLEIKHRDMGIQGVYDWVRSQLPDPEHPPRGWQTKTEAWLADEFDVNDLRSVRRALKADLGERWRNWR